MGLLELLNPKISKNPVYRGFDSRRNAIGQFGLGMIGGGGLDKMRNAALGGMQGRQADSAYALEQQKQRDAQAQLQQAEQQKNQTVEWLASQGANDIVQGIQMGAYTPGEAYAEYNRRNRDAIEARQPEYKVVGSSLVQIGPDGVSPVYEGSQSSNTDQWGFPNSSAQSQKMRALTLQGIDEQTALGIVSGRYDVRTNPQTGETSIVDLTTQSIAPLSGQQAEVPAPVGSPQTGPNATNSTLWEISDQATGIGSGLANAAANTLGQVPGDLGEAFSFPEQVSAKQEFGLFKRELILSLSLNPRFPISEQKRIENLVPIGVGIAPPTLKLALVALNGELSRIEADMIRSLQNRNTPVDQRQKDMQTLRGVQVAIQRIGLPSNGQGGQGDDPTGLRNKYGLE